MLVKTTVQTYNIEYSGYLKVARLCVYSNCADMKVKEGKYARLYVSLVGNHGDETSYGKPGVNIQERKAHLLSSLQSGHRIKLTKNAKELLADRMFATQQ